MDGVVADFNALASNIIGRKIGWGGDDISDEEWEKLAVVPDLYLQLSPIPQGRDLVKLALSLSKEVKFLTAIPRRKISSSVEEDKRKWLSIYYPGIPMEVGPHSSDKYKWCYPGDILVDDRLSNIIDWFEHGGISIYHIGNWNETLNNLKKAHTINKPVILY